MHFVTVRGLSIVAGLATDRLAIAFESAVFMMFHLCQHNCRLAGDIYQTTCCQAMTLCVDIGPAGFPTIAYRHLSELCNRLQIGAMLEGIALSPRNALDWTKTALRRCRIVKNAEAPNFALLALHNVFIALPMQLAADFITTGTLHLRECPLGQLKAHLSIDSAIRKLLHWLSQGHFSNFVESPIAVIAYHPHKETLTPGMKTASGVGGQKHWHNVSWIGSSYATIVQDDSTEDRAAARLQFLRLNWQLCWLCKLIRHRIHVLGHIAKLLHWTRTKCWSCKALPCSTCLSPH